MRALSRILLALLLAAAVAAPQLAGAQVPLRKSTASQAVKVGPFVSSTDGNTEQTALTIANTDIKLSKAGGTMASKNSGGGTHDALAYYTVTLDATDTNTTGLLQMMVHPTGALPITMRFMVLETAIYDGLYASGAAAVPANTVQLNGTTTACSGGSVPLWSIIDCGTAQAVTSTTIQLRSAASFDNNNELNGATVIITSATTGAGQSRVITAYTNSTDTATVAAWTTTPTGTITYMVVATPPNNFDTAATQIANLYQGWDNSNLRWNATAMSQAPVSNQKLRSSTTSSAGSTSSFIDSSIAETVDNALKDYWVRFTSGSNAGFTARIIAYATSTKGVTLAETLPASVASGVTYDLYADAPERLAGITHANATIATVNTVNALGSTAVSNIWAYQFTEPSGAPTWTSNAGQWIAWLGAWSRNKITQTGSGGTGQKCLRNDADSTNLSCATVTDDGTTLTVGKAP